KLKVPAIYLVLVGCVCQVVGYALLSTVGVSLKIEAAVYGYMVLCGFGCGLTYFMLWITVPFVTEKRDQAVAMGAANQFRVMGSAMGLAIATSVFNGYVLPRLKSLGIKDPALYLANGYSQLAPDALKMEIRSILSEGYNRQMMVLAGLSASQIPA
ncbi:hypothetical protein N0V82_010863, partial [Gnomoniopsis sp. IMI 355080]